MSRNLKQYIAEYKRAGQLIRQLTIKDLAEETPEVQARRIARLLDPKHYNAFFCYYFGGGDKYALADSACADFHIQATKKLVAARIINQFRLWFRGSVKSTHTNIGNLFLLKQKKESRFAVIVGANELRTNLLLADLQIHLEYNERIIKDFGAQVSYGHWSRGMFETTDGCYFMGLGIDQPFRGLRRYANRIDFACVDDIEDREVANNPRRVRQRGEKILSDLGGAFSKARARLVLCNNYITNTGVLRYLLDKIGDSPYTDVSKVAITDAKGAPTWSQRYTKEDIAVQRHKTDYYSWMREFMNTPMEEGKIFQQKWLQYAPMPPLSEMAGLVIYGDLSYKETGDYKALVLVGKKGRCFYIIAAFVQQTTRARCAEWLYDLYEDMTLQNYPISYFIEGLFAQDEFTSDFDAEGDRRGYYIPVVADKRPSKANTNA